MALQTYILIKNTKSVVTDEQTKNYKNNYKIFQRLAVRQGLNPCRQQSLNYYM
jgi:hypothetical protein